MESRSMFAWAQEQRGETAEGHKGAFQGDRDLYLDWGGGYTGIYICQNL